MTGNITFVVAAFAVTWAVMLGYLIHLRRTTRRARAAFDQTAGTGARS